MDILSGSTYVLTRLVFQRGLALVYLLAFIAAINQFRPLLGERGLLPVPKFLQHVSFAQAPSIFHLYFSDRFALVVAWLGAILAIAALIGLVERLPLWASVGAWVAMWALYLSIVNVGQRWYAFGWESLLLETGFLAIFLGNRATAPPAIIIWLLRWVVVRLEFGAGLIKLRGDSCWRDLTCLDYHHETQPMPNPLSWFFHHLPRPLHRLEVLGNHFAQLVAPFGLFVPGRVAAIAGGVMIATQGWLMLSGNFAFLNLITIVLALTAFDDAHLRAIAGFFSLQFPTVTASLAEPPVFRAAVLLVSVLIVVLSIRPVRNMFSRNQLMNASFEPLHLVNTYGAFGSVTKERYEIVLEGTDEVALTSSTKWREYGFKGKPGDPRRRPPQVAPYHLRLDWLMWFLPFNGYPPPGYETWFVRLAQKLLEGDRPTFALLRTNPFPASPPQYVRARYYQYRFTTRKEREETGAWWNCTLVGEYLPPVSRADLQRVGKNP